jgi:serine/threonine-protein kinase
LNALPEDFLKAVSDRYRVVRELGRGGMATVYLAEDVRHGRRVALKVLDPEFARAVGTERFLREIRTAAQLSHPHIVPLFDSGEASDHVYYVMPFVEGETLRDRLRREGPLPVDEAVDLVRQLATALDYAHSKGLVHRDIKPENVLLSSGQALLADFGIARSTNTSPGARLTEPGTTLGTAAYMSPEQCAGSDVDGRADLYSLGCVLYELLAGQPPFTGHSNQSLIHQHLSVAPRDVTQLRPAVPPALAATTMRLLAKAQADRVQTAAELESGLGAFREGRAPLSTSTADAPTSPIPTSGPAISPHRKGWNRVLVVTGLALVLVVTTWISDRRWQAERRSRTAPPATKEWILVADFDSPDTILARSVRTLLCSALDQSSVVRTVPAAQIRAALEASERTPTTRVTEDIARELAVRSSVRTLIAGDVIETGSTYVITARLEQADSVAVLTTVAKQAKSADGIVQAVESMAHELRSVIHENPNAIRSTKSLALVRTGSFDAVRHWTNAVWLINVRKDQLGAIAELRAALGFDPDFAAAWGALGVAYGNAGEYDSAKVCLQKSLVMGSRLEDGQKAFYRAILAYDEDNLEEALEHAAEAVRLGWPNSGQITGNLLASLGRPAEALDYYRLDQRQVASFPGPLIRSNEWECLMNLGRFAEAESIATAPGQLPHMQPYQWLAMGQWVRAESTSREVARDVTVLEEFRVEALRAEAAALAAQGRVTEARTILASTRQIARVSQDSRLETEELWSFLDMLQGDWARPPWGETSGDGRAEWQASLAFRFAISGRADAAQHELAKIGSARLDVGSRPYFELAHGALDFHERRYMNVVNRISGPARTALVNRLAIFGEGAQSARWLVAQAFELSGELDSAAVYYQLLSEHGSCLTNSWAARAIALPFALEKLVILNARLGRYDEADARLADLKSLLSKPDSSMRGLIPNAESAIAAARSREGPERGATR